MSLATLFQWYSKPRFCIHQIWTSVRAVFVKNLQAYLWLRIWICRCTSVCSNLDQKENWVFKFRGNSMGWNNKRVCWRKMSGATRICWFRGNCTMLVFKSRHDQKWWKFYWSVQVIIFWKELGVFRQVKWIHIILERCHSERIPWFVTRIM